MGAHELNLIPTPRLLAIRLRRRLRFWLQVGLPVLLVFPAVRIDLDRRLRSEERLLQAAVQRDRDRQRRQAELADLETLRDELGHVLLERRYFVPTGSPLELFPILEAAMAPGLYLRSLRVEPAAGGPGRALGPAVTPNDAAPGETAVPAFDVRLEGTASSNDLVASFLLGLAVRPDMSHTVLDFSRSEKGDRGRSVIFAVSTRYQPAAAGGHSARGEGS